MTQDLDPAVVTGTSSEAMERATGKPWAAWMEILDSAGGRQMSHKQLVAHLVEQHGVAPWWRQQIAVGYEQSRGLREKHEMTDGYQISRSRTIAAPAATLYDAWLAGGRSWLPDADFTIRKATPHKNIRLNWADGTLVEVRLNEKGPGKTAVTVQQSKLPDVEAAERMKAYWAAALENLQALFT
jgi:uncharacterized protein YndB with AHSA1/START domain